MKIYTIEEDHSDTTGFSYVVGVFSSEYKAEKALDQLKTDHDKLMDCCVEEFKIFDYELDQVELKTYN